PHVLALAATPLVGDARLEDGLILGSQRRLLGEAGALGLVPLDAGAGRPFPLARPVRIVRQVLRTRAGYGEGRPEHHHSERASVAHDCLLLPSPTVISVD